MKSLKELDVELENLYRVLASSNADPEMSYWLKQRIQKLQDEMRERYSERKPALFEISGRAGAS